MKKSLFPTSLVFIPLLLILTSISACDFTSNQPAFKESQGQSPEIKAVDLKLVNTWLFDGLSALAWAPDSTSFAISAKPLDSYFELQLYTVAQDEPLWRVSGLYGGISFSEDGEQLIASHANVIILYHIRAEDGKELSTLESNDCRAGDWVLPNIDPRFVLAGKGYGKIELKTSLGLWDLEEGNCQEILNTRGFLVYLDSNKDQSTLLISLLSYNSNGLQRNILVWSKETKRELCTIPGNIALFVPHSELFVVSKDDKMEFYEATTCAFVRELQIEEPLDGYIAFDESGELFATVGKSLQVRKTTTGELMFDQSLPEKTFPRYSNPRLMFSPNGTYLLGAFAVVTDGDFNHALNLWSVDVAHKQFIFSSTRMRVLHDSAAALDERADPFNIMNIDEVLKQLDPEKKYLFRVHLYTKGHGRMRIHILEETDTQLKDFGVIEFYRVKFFCGPMFWSASKIEVNKDAEMDEIYSQIGEPKNLKYHKSLYKFYSENFVVKIFAGGGEFTPHAEMT